MFRPSPWLLPLTGPASLLYRAAVAARNLRYDAGGGVRSLERPVASVGNLVIGGAGKTPVVLRIAEHLREAGVATSILSRGYGREGESVAAVVSDRERMVARGPRTAGDEPYLLAARLPGVPVVVSRDRWEAGRIVERMGRVDLHLLDDGFQHRRLARAFDLVLVDAREGFGNRRLLPAGPLREPVGSLRRASAILLTRWSDGLDTRDLIARIERHAPGIPVFRATLVPDSIRPVGEGAEIPLPDLHGRKVAAFCGIANPRGFRESLESLGAALVSFRSFRDHHFFLPDQMRDLHAEARQKGADVWITTEKDAVRVPLLHAGLHYLRVRAELQEWPALFRLLAGRTGL